jgi:uncharacterized membrane protein
MNDNLAPGFSNGEALRFGWNQTKGNLKPWLILGGVGLFLTLLHQALTAPGGVPGLRALLSIAVQLLQVALTIICIRAALMVHDGQPIDLWHPAALLGDFFSYLLTSILCGLIVAGGLVLLIVPGVIWGLKYGYSGFLVIDRKVDPIEALRESGQLTQGAKGKLFEFAALVFCVNLLGAIALGVGLFVTIPTTLIAAAFVFRKLQARAALRLQAPAPTPGIPAPAPTH